MRKGLMFLLILCMLLWGCAAPLPDDPSMDVPEETVPLEHYEYPITSASPEWPDMTVGEKVEALKIPQEKLEAMTDEELIRALADYPYLINLGVYGKSTEESIETVRGYCSALDELLSRETAAESLDDYGRKLAQAYGRAAEEDSVDSGHYEVVESLLNEIIGSVCGTDHGE